MRRFRLQDNLQVLFDYLTSEGRMLGEYKLLTTFPKRDVSHRVNSFVYFRFVFSYLVNNIELDRHIRTVKIISPRATDSRIFVNCSSLSS